MSITQKTSTKLLCSLIHSFIMLSVLRQLHMLFQSKFSTVLLPFSISSILSFPQGFPVAAYVFFIVFPSLVSFPLFFLQKTCFRWQFIRKILLIQLTCSFHCITMLLSFLTLRNTSLFLTWSVRLIFAILLQHNISDLSRRIWCCIIH
jgi:hypothetical protein